MTLRRAFITAAAALTLAGCASTLDTQVKSQIKTVSLELKLADKPVVATPGTGLLALTTGYIGLAMQQAGTTDIREHYRQIVAKHVDVNAEITRTARRELEQRGYRVVEAGQPSDAKLTIEGNYALGLASLLGDERGAGTTLGAHLRTPDGRRLWTNNALGLKGDPAMKAKIRLAPFEQWFKDEALVAEQHKLVAQMVTAEVLQGL